MKHFCLLVTMTIFALRVNSQTGSSTQWMFVKGDSALPASAYYGTRGIFSNHNTPGGRISSLSWKDTSGNWWMFGGYGLDSIGKSGYFNDLWKYNISIKQWAWVKGDSLPNGKGSYGTQGQTSIANNPGAGRSGISWTDNLGNLWFFRGEVWKYNPTNNEWTWVKGDSIPITSGNYGSLGIAAESNTPVGLTGSVSWIDKAGNLWIFGGWGSGRIAPGEEGAGAIGSGVFNHIWKYNPSTNLWTWMNGDSTVPRTVTKGIYGTRGISARENTPPPRLKSASWIDTSGNLWIFGGDNRNDLWKYDLSNNHWTWLKGDSTTGSAGVYGTKGVPADDNRPGFRSESASWIDASGDMWLFGGTSTGLLNDLWKYSPSTNKWTWMKGDSTKNVIRTYGARGVPAETNTPGGRSQIQSWKDAYGKLWLFGGFGVDSILSSGGTIVRPLNDLWKYDPSNNQWTWMAGDSAKNSLGSYGAKGTAATTNTPKPRHYYNLILTDTLADVWLFGGMEGVHPLNDLWTYNSSLNQWAWLNGDSLGVIPATYGTRGIPAAANKPGPRQESVSWTDTSSNLWLFGGQGNPTGKVGVFNDLWKYESTNGQWTWVKGDSIEDVSTSYANYGSDSTYRPSARAASASWKDLSGNLWLYGGSGWAGFRFGHLNDLWKYNITTNNWTWINGGTYFYSAPVYGTKGIAAADNQPGGRSESVSYTDASGNLWLFGGRSYTGGGQTTYFNDFWKYDPSSNLWTWISGNNTANVEGTYGTLVIPDALNNPGSRSSSASWTDTTGNFWLFGGVGYDANGKYGSLNDLWKYTVSTNEWTWMNGDNTANFAGTYGTQGTTAAANKPGSRYNSAGWKDALNNLWLFGGTGFAVTDSGALNDLWKYNISTNQWTWVKGDNTINVAGSYSMPGTSVEANKPGARSSSVSWTDASGKFWLFGGRGLFVNAEGILNDLWNISSMDLLPIKLLSFSGKIINKDVSLSWQTTEEINTGYYNIQRSLNGAEFETIGKVNAFFFNSGMNDHLFTDVNAFATNSATLFYRLEIINKDNSKTYSNIIKLNLFNAKQSIVISPNPSFSTMTISISNNKTEAATLIICDMKGVIIRKENISLINGTMSKAINVSMLKSGAYIATLMSSQKQQKKFIKQ